MVDLRPSIQIDPNQFRPTTDPYGSIIPSFQQGQDRQEVMRQRAQAVAELQRKRLAQQKIQEALKAAFTPGQPQRLEGPALPGMPPPMSQGAPAQGLNDPNLIQLVMGEHPEMLTQLMSNRMSQDPYKQQLEQAKAEALRTGANGKPMTEVYRDPKTGELSDTPKDGWIKFKVSQAQALGAEVSREMQGKKLAAASGRNEVLREGINARQINQLAKSTTLSPQQKNSLQQNNIRADRAIDILSKPNITWQEFSFALQDFSGMMQGGVPHVDALHNAAFPSYKEKSAQWKTYISGTPTANVPRDTKNYMLNLTKRIKDIDNQYLTKNAQFQKSLLLPTIKNGKAVGQAVDQGTQEFNAGAGPGGSADPLGLFK